MHRSFLHRRTSGVTPTAKPSGYPRTGKYGFTLIELLVVIAIISLLAAILFPVFARARENARRSACQSNLRQIGMGLMQYTQDYDEFLPTSGADGSDTTAGRRDPKWMDKIFPYVKSEQLFSCSSDRSNIKYIYSSGPNSSRNTRAFGSYLINAGYSGPAATPTGPNGARMSQIGAASETIYALEGYTYKAGNADFWFATNNTPSAYLNENPKKFARSKPADDEFGAATWHLETGGTLFCDGHVKSMRVDQWAVRHNGVYYLFSNEND